MKIKRLALAAILSVLATLAFAAPAQASCGCGIPLKILPIGDSITRGVGVPSVDGYRIELQKRLDIAGVPYDFVGSQTDGSTPGFDYDHEGHGGWTIQQMTQAVGGWVTAADPDLVILHAGTNDVLHNIPDMEPRLNYLMRLIQEAKPGVTIIVQQIIGTAGASRQARIDTFNAAIPGLSWVNKPNVYVVNQSNIRGLNLYDGVHPNAYGYQKMAYNIYMKMRQVYSGNAWPTGTNPYNNPGPLKLCFTDGCWWYYRGENNGVVTWTRGEPA